MPIETETQYNITKLQAERFAKALLQVEKPMKEYIHPMLVKIRRDAIQSQLEELESAVQDYEYRERIMEPVVNYDKIADAISIEFEPGKASYSKELDEDRIVDYSEDDRPIGVVFHNVRDSISLKGLPYVTTIAIALTELGVTMREDTE